MNLKNYFDQLVALPSKEIAEFALGLKEIRYAKGEMFTRIGELSDGIGFVKAGFFRVCYLTSDGKVVIRNFSYEGKREVFSNLFPSNAVIFTEDTDFGRWLDEIVTKNELLMTQFGTGMSSVFGLPGQIPTE